MTENSITTKDFYFCYTREISDLLKRHNISYILKAKSVRDDKIFTLYQRTEELERILGVK